MPYVDSSGVDIHYHVEGNGPPLVVQHGLTGSLKNWYAYGFVEKLQDKSTVSCSYISIVSNQHMYISIEL